MQWLKVAILVGTLVLFALAAFPFGHEIIEAAGKNLPKQDIAGDYAWGLFWAALLGVSVLFWPVSARDKRNLAWLWAAKVVVALGLMLVYEWSYGLDAFGYFWLGQPGLYAGDGLAYGQGTEIIQWLSNLHWRYLIGDSYHAMKLTFAYVGFLGAYFFYRAAVTAFQYSDVRLLWVIASVPSVMQWSSILGKDPIAFFGIGLYAWGVTRLSIPMIAGGIFLAASTRPWLAMILLAPLVSFAWVGAKRPIAKAAILVASVGGFFVALTLFSDRLQVGSVDDAVERTEVISQSFAKGGSANTSELAENNSVQKMLLFAPVGAFSALFRPLPGEVPNLFGTLAGLENLLLLGLAFLALRRGRFSDFKQPLVLWATLLVLIWSFIYGFVSFHNMGSGARFRLQIMPVLVCLLLYMARVLQRRKDAEKLRRRVFHRARREHGVDASRQGAILQGGRAVPPRRP